MTQHYEAASQTQLLCVRAFPFGGKRFTKIPGFYLLDGNKMSTDVLAHFVGRMNFAHVMQRGPRDREVSLDLLCRAWFVMEGKKKVGRTRSQGVQGASGGWKLVRSRGFG